MAPNPEMLAQMNHDRWWRHVENYPDEQHCELVWNLSQALMSLWDAVLIGNPPPATQETFERMNNPQVGDLVLETSSVWQRDWPERALGYLVSVNRPKKEGLDLGLDRQWVVNPLYYPDDALTTWENCSFIAAPWNPERYMKPRGRVVITRDSLVGALAEKGMDVHP